MIQIRCDHLWTEEDTVNRNRWSQMICCDATEKQAESKETRYGFSKSSQQIAKYSVKKTSSIQSVSFMNRKIVKWNRNNLFDKKILTKREETLILH